MLKGHVHFRISVAIIRKSFGSINRTIAKNRGHDFESKDGEGNLFIEQ